MTNFKNKAEKIITPSTRDKTSKNNLKIIYTVSNSDKIITDESHPANLKINLPLIKQGKNHKKLSTEDNSNSNRSEYKFDSSIFNKSPSLYNQQQKLKNKLTINVVDNINDNRNNKFTYSNRRVKTELIEENLNTITKNSIDFSKLYSDKLSNWRIPNPEEEFKKHKIPSQIIKPVQMNNLRFVYKNLKINPYFIINGYTNQNQLIANSLVLGQIHSSNMNKLSLLNK